MSELLPTGVPIVRGYPKLVVPTVPLTTHGGRGLTFVNFNDPHHEVDVATGPLDEDMRRLMRAFFARTQTGMRTVFFQPAYLGVPRAYMNDPNNAALSNDGVLLSGSGTYTANINSVTNGLAMSVGDWVSMHYNGYASFHWVTSDAVATGGGISFTVEPKIPTYIQNNAGVLFKNMRMNTRVVPGSVDFPDEMSASASFKLQEVPK